MDEIIIKKLDTSLWEYRWSVRVKGVLEHACNAERFIDVYRISATTRGGLLKYRNFGVKSLNEVERGLQEFGLPSLDSSRQVVKLYDSKVGCIKSSVGEVSLVIPDGLAHRVLQDILRGLGRQHDDETVRRVLDIVRSD
ncbi:MAG: hypothetical protein Q8P86_03075 [bacterium]|nr:hypothetical protein [bacterium]